MSWLERINFYRGSNGLPAIRDTPAERRDRRASHYLLLNFTDDIRSGKPIPT